jgi:hypothetical protein
MNRGQSRIFTQKGTLFTINASLKGLRGNCPALAGRLGEGRAFALCASGWGDRLQCSLRPDPAAAWPRGQSRIFTQNGTLFTINAFLKGLRGNGPALAGRLGEGRAFALCARERVIAFNARSGPIPLLPGWWMRVEGRFRMRRRRTSLGAAFRGLDLWVWLVWFTHGTHVDSL